jgi:cell division septation protein DedD
LAHPTQDDGFHEIQLNGKQLVFLFMAATVVSVVIFLCGVLVGRGVRTERGTLVADAAAAGSPADTLPQAPAAATPTPTPGSDPTTASPPPAADDLSYFNRLEKASPAPEQLKAGPPAKAPPAVVIEKPAPVETRPAPTAPPAKAPPPPQRAVPADSGGEGWAVQIAALNVRGEAEAIAKRVSSKGYSAYVVPPADGTSVYRVRVGKFSSRREAEAMKTKLEKEEQFKPWITR